MGNKTVIWTLNKAYDLIAGPTDHETAEEVQEELCKQLDEKVEFGQRPDSGNQLMPDGEYFVPIAPKCLGEYLDPDKQQGLSEETKVILADIAAYYNKAGQKNYTEFWDSVTDNYQMKTEKYKGYYSLLEENESNILIGYSQGGLVARYLYWLDRVVFKKNLVKGIVTVSSPNFGSPLANPDNTQSIFENLWKIILILMGKEAKDLEDLLQLSEHLSLDDALSFITTFNSRINEESHLSLLSAEDSEKQSKLSDFLTTLYNWLGGLRNDPDNAFYDLNIMRLEPQSSPGNPNSSVLSAVSDPSISYEPVHGIISANWHIEDILYDGVQAVVLSILRKCIKGKTEFAIAAAATELGLEDLAENIENHTITASAFAQINRIYKEDLMQENISGDITNPLITDIISKHKNGIADPVSIEENAHDFVIPSAYQLTLDNTHAVSPENQVNEEANHLSGGCLDYSAGEDNKNQIVDYLSEIVGVEQWV